MHGVDFLGDVATGRSSACCARLTARPGERCDSDQRTRSRRKLHTPFEQVMPARLQPTGQTGAG